MLNLMQPQAAGRQRVGVGGEARRDEAGRKSTRTGKHDGREVVREYWTRQWTHGHNNQSSVITSKL